MVMIRAGWGYVAVIGVVLSWGCAEIKPAAVEPLAGEFVSPWRTITGAWRDVERGAPEILPPAATAPNRIQLQYPIGVAARGNDVFVADGGLHQVLRYDRGHETLTPFAPFTSLSADQAIGLYIAADQSLYVADPARRRVIHFDRLGRERRTFADDLNLARPVGVVVIDGRGDVLVADGQYNHIVVFNSLGRSLSVLHTRGDAPFKSVSAMAAGPDGLYLVDRSARAVVVIGIDGTPGYVLGDPALKMPRSVAVDRDNRVFVSDDFDDTIKVFVAKKLAATVGRQGAAQGRFSRPAALAVDENVLYVADSLNGRLQLFQVAPQALGPREAR